VCLGLVVRLCALAIWRRASCVQHVRKLWALHGRHWLPALLQRGLWLRVLDVLLLRHALVIAVVVVGLGLHGGQFVPRVGYSGDGWIVSVGGCREIGFVYRSVAFVETGGRQLSTSNPTQSDSNPDSEQPTCGGAAHNVKAPTAKGSAGLLNKISSAAVPCFPLH
jgi:hypothetical protein